MNNFDNVKSSSIRSMSDLWAAANTLQTNTSPIFEDDEKLVDVRDRLIEEQIELAKNIQGIKAQTVDQVWEKLNIWAMSVDLSELDNETYDSHHQKVALSAIQDLSDLLGVESDKAVNAA